MLNLIQAGLCTSKVKQKNIREHPGDYSRLLCAGLMIASLSGEATLLPEPIKISHLGLQSFFMWLRLGAFNCQSGALSKIQKEAA